MRSRMTIIARALCAALCVVASQAHATSANTHIFTPRASQPVISKTDMQAEDPCASIKHKQRIAEAVREKLRQQPTTFAVFAMLR